MNLSKYKIPFIELTFNISNTRKIKISLIVFSFCSIVSSFAIIAIMFAFIPPKHGLTGRWMIYNPDGTPSQELLDFKNDGTYTITLTDGRIGERGYYKLKHSVTIN